MSVSHCLDATCTTPMFGQMQLHAVSTITRECLEFTDGKTRTPPQLLFVRYNFYIKGISILFETTTTAVFSKTISFQKHLFKF